MPISFEIKQVRDYFFYDGFVYTLRTERKTIGKDWVHNKRNGRKIADCEIKFITKITNPNQLNDYVKHSGISSVNEWLSLAKPKARYLYRIDLIDGGVY